MDRKALNRLRRALEQARRSPQTAGDLEALAVMAGRKSDSGGNHVMWKTDHFPHRSFPIPRHGGNPVYTGHPRKVILNALDADADAWEELLEEKERKLKKVETKNGTG